MKKTLLVFVYFLFLVTLASCDQTVTHYNDDAHSQLSYVKDYDQFKQLIEQNQNSYNRFYSEAVFEEGVFESVEMDDSTSSETSNISSTNVQVRGIDEGDIVKVDDSRIYMLSYDAFHVIDISTDTMSLLLSQSLESTREDSSYTYYQELYITENEIIVIGQRYAYYLQSRDGQTKDSDFIEIEPWYYFGLPESVVEIYDKASLKLQDTFLVSGYLSSSRLINNRLYVITKQDIFLYEDIDPRPQLTHNSDVYMQPYENIQYIASLDALENYTNILFIEFNDTLTYELKTYLGQSYWGHTYVTFDSIYFAGNTYQFDEVTNTYVTKGIIIRYIIDNDGSTSFGGYQTYEGYIINQFAIDQYDQTLRLVTTDGWGDTVVNRLYIFSLDMNENNDPSLSLLALLDEGIGKPRERVQSVRFNEDIVTIVTFELTDPLYIIDISDPTQPTITSELEITGFATYQHPWKNDTLLNIGYETDNEGRIIGLKISLFDTSDITNLIQIGSELTFLNGNQGWTYSEALHNHKALLFSEIHDFFGFAMTHYQWIETSVDTNYMNIQDYMLFDIDLNNTATPLSVKATFSHQFFIQSLTLDTNAYYLSYTFGIQRAVYVDDTIYFISLGGVTSYDLNDLTTMTDSLLLYSE
ncbi:MAG: beta-propeller domain-containing protein [Acholeplasmataceae bacterium]